MAHEKETHHEMRMPQCDVTYIVLCLFTYAYRQVFTDVTERKLLNILVDRNQSHYLYKRWPGNMEWGHVLYP